MKRVFEDLTNRIFNKLKVIKYYGKIKEKSFWICLCNCGRTKEFVVRSDSLKSGATTRCGRCSSEKVGAKNLHDLVGQVFGRLIVIERGDDYISPLSGKKRAKWICQCECGKILSVKSYSLKNGNTKSCGCQSESKIASNIKLYFLNNYNAILEYKVFRNPETNRYLPYDIYLVNNNVFIEINGRQHYKITNFHIMQSIKNNSSAEEEFEYQKKKDRLKKKFAKKNGTYIEINLLKIKTTEDAIGYITKKLT